MVKTKMIDTTKYPFKIDHGKCFNCQSVPNLTEDERDGKTRTGSSWQKGVHLCSSCQWHVANLALQIRVDNAIKRELSEIESITSDYEIWFDEVTPQEAIDRLEKEESHGFARDEEIEEAIKRLKQIVELGFNKLKVIA